MQKKKNINTIESEDCAMDNMKGKLKNLGIED